MISIVLYDQYSKEVLVKKAEYECQLRRSNNVVLSPPSEVEESRDLEWDLLVLNSPAKQAGRRKSIVEQLKDDGKEEFAPKFTIKSEFDELKSTNVEDGTASKLRSKPCRAKTFAERLKDTSDEEFVDSDTYVKLFASSDCMGNYEAGTKETYNAQWVNSISFGKSGIASNTISRGCHREVKG
ncbi:hypothetical protein BGZ82_009851 [Podila clonocystis]|nr:hypothetical protein BGZ82_009851 [Podila clonocystis]